MVLVDTSVWADHFRAVDARLAALLGAEQVYMHPFVLGELALGNLREWSRTVAMLAALPSLAAASQRQMLALIPELGLSGSGLGFVDAHLLAAARATRVPLWTRDRRLHARAAEHELAWTA